MRAYRLVKARYADNALDGSGSKAFGGRWNSKGVAMVYASDSIALAVLELLIHLHRAEILNHYTLFELDIAEEQVMSLDDGALPPDWRNDPAPSSTAAIGDEWIASGSSVALTVPSTLVPRQRNILFNPAHGDFEAVIASVSSSPFDLESRLAK